MFNLKINKTMVTIVDYKTIEKEDGEKFYALEVQGGIESIRSQETGRNYFTARKATVACTFNETMCKSLVGQELPGVIVRVEVEEYEYTVPGTDDTIMLSHRYEYQNPDEAIVNKQVVKKEVEVF